MTPGPLPWDKIRKDIERAIRQIYPRSRFVKSEFIAREVIINPVKYPSFKNVNERTAKVRIATIFDDLLKWKVFSKNGHGKCYIKPRGWT